MKNVAPILCFVAAVVGGVWFAWSATTPRSGTGQTIDQVPLTQLPAEATQIDYWILPPTTAFSFDAGEQAFETWVTGFQRPGVERADGSTAATVIDPTTGRTDHVLLKNAIQYTWRKDDASLQLTYDRDQQRAYYYGHYR